MMYPYASGFGNYGMPFGGWFGLVFMIFWWVVIIIVAILIIRWAIHFHRSHKEEKSPTEIVKERYARGDITKKEYEELKKDLE